MIDRKVTFAQAKEWEREAFEEGYEHGYDDRGEGKRNKRKEKAQLWMDRLKPANDK